MSKKEDPGKEKDVIMALRIKNFLAGKVGKKAKKENRSIFFSLKICYNDK